MVDLVGKKVACGEVMLSSMQKGKGKKKDFPIVLAVSALAVIALAVVLLLPKNGDEQSQDAMYENDSIEITQLPVYRLSTGDEYIYEGELDSLGVPNGFGKAVFDDREYEGYFKDGDMEGYGELTITEGKWKNRIYKALFTENRIVDTCTMLTGVYEFHGTLKEDMDYCTGMMIDLETGKVDRYENGNWVEELTKK